MAAVLQGLTRLAILGDFTRAGEGVAVDDISAPGCKCWDFIIGLKAGNRSEISTADAQPSFPLACQQAGAHSPVKAPATARRT